ncbi:chorismate mutase [Erwinia persicina]|uniref:chorismate mutase n=1 Tax=Erwinia persicina TaxID=55211 RepID=A0A4U3F7R3_9GAMM|nr:chorismate mutase [Erwinia persicina]MBD8105509.1 chorismate mutase [Erwinia persicina]MBD8211574.1 chorismate mutase [Erwinia persicina]TKJ89284.1 chorismate mutase [Erwinia persicina]
MNFTTLEEVRHRIDQIDSELVHIIAQRAECVKAAASFKKDPSAVRAPDRVQQVIDKVCKTAVEEGLPVVIIEKVYRTMIGAFIDYELEQHGQLRKEKI